MTFDEAESTVMPFGKHKGLTFGEILDEDPSYLVWMEAEITWNSERLEEAFTIFMSEPSVQADILIAEEDREFGWD